MPDFAYSGLKTLINCPLCQARYHPLSAKTIKENDEAQLLHLECRQCGSQVLVLAMTDLSAGRSIGLVTDLKSEEVDRFQQEKEIGMDEVIDFHFMINNKALVFGQY